MPAYILSSPMSLRLTCAKYAWLMDPLLGKLNDVNRLIKPFISAYDQVM